MIGEFRIADAVSRVLVLQAQYASQKTEAMTERGSLLNEIRDSLRESVSNSSPPLRVKAGNGAGLPARVPWVSVSDPRKSTSAQNGYYLVYLFAADGSAVFLSLALGITDLDERRAQEIVSGARRQLAAADPALTSVPRSTTIRLAESGLGRKYEYGTIEALRYPSEHLPTDEVLRADLDAMLGRMHALPLTLNGNASLSFEYVPQSGAPAENLADAISWPIDKAEELLDSLGGARPQVVLQGPPGTGKSFVARAASSVLLGTHDPRRTRFVQFHPSYGYEEFVEGLRPTATDSAALEFVRTPGVLLRMAQEIEADALDRVLIIDEMNRANLPRVFGELLYLLEYRDRTIDLMLERSFQLPRGLKFIGTMNTADRSAQSLDAALRRRFDFFAVAPEVEVLRRHYAKPGVENLLGNRLFDGFERLNRQLETDLDSRDLLIGHSYFMTERMDDLALARLFRRQLRPLLEDYFFLERAKLDSYRFEELFRVNG